MATPRPLILAALKKAYAASYGLTDRTARRDAANKTPRWQKFVSESHLSAPVPNEPTPPEASKPDDELSEPEKMVKHGWDIYLQTMSAWHKATTKGQDIIAIGFGAATIKAQQNYHKAIAGAEAWKLSQRQTVSWQEWQEAFAAIGDIFALLKSLPTDVSLTCNPAAPAQARDAIQRWLEERFQPQVEGVLQRVIDSPMPA